MPSSRPSLHARPADRCNALDSVLLKSPKHMVARKPILISEEQARLVDGNKTKRGCTMPRYCRSNVLASTARRSPCPMASIHPSVPIVPREPLFDSWPPGFNGTGYVLLDLFYVLLHLGLAGWCSTATTQLSTMSDDELLERVQKQTFRYFWDFGHPVSGLARERTDMGFGQGEVVTIGGSGFGVMAIVVGAERRWIRRQEASGRLLKILRFLAKADRFHGIFPHWMNGTSGKYIRFGKDDSGGDLVETSYLVQGLLAARQYFDAGTGEEALLRGLVDALWREVEWTWHMLPGRDVLYWNDPHQEGVYRLWVSGWNECLITYVQAAASPTHPIEAKVYHKGWARSGDFRNGKDFFGIRLPLGQDFGGPLFFSHYSFLGLDPRGLKDRYADYWEQNVNHTLINYEHCVRNPKGFKGYGEACWGLTASASPGGYRAHSPTNDVGTIAPTAALSAMPYTPDKSMRALRHFHDTMGDKLWGEYGLRDAFNEGKDWVKDAYLAIDQGPIVAMLENHRTGLLWKLFMSCPEVQAGLRKLGFESPHLDSGKS